MIDIKLLRENPQLVQKSSADKGVEINVEHILGLDNKVRGLDLIVQKLREERNKVSKAASNAVDKKNIEKGKELKTRLDKEEKALNAVLDELNKLLLQIPNFPASGVPIGDADKFEVLKTEGKPTKFDFDPKDHLELGEKLDIIDVQRAAKVSGTRFGYLKNEGALLEFALVNFALEVLVKEGFTPVVPPVLIKKEVTDKLGYWQGTIDEKHTSNENYYLVHDPKEESPSESPEMYLIGTAEHALIPMHRDEVFNTGELPKRYVGFSSSFRREAGTYGKDTRGILRVHQFDKVEMVEFVKPEDDEKERRKMLSLSESLLQKLELPYRVVKLTAEDIAFPTAETIDIETWIPSQDKYRETHSISTTTDFQSRRLNIKYQDGNEKKYVHILNGTAFAIGRTIIAILENNQQEDGSIIIPKVLHKYLNFTKISSRTS